MNVYIDFHPYSVLHRKLVRIASRILHQYMKFSQWPRYYQSLLLCCNLNQHYNKLKLATYCYLNRFNFKAVAFIIRVLNYYSEFKFTTVLNIKKFIKYQEYFDLHQGVWDIYMSYDLSSKTIKCLNGRVITNIPNNSGIVYIPCGSASSNLHRVGFHF